METLEPLEQKAIQEILDQEESKVNQVLLVTVAYQVLQVPRDLLALQVHQGNQAQEERLEQLG